MLCKKLYINTLSYVIIINQQQLYNINDLIYNKQRKFKRDMSHVENTPKFIKQVPWYAQNNDGQTQATNKTQAGSKMPMQQWYERGKKGFQATTYRKGACENCGALGHNKKQCTQRPRKTGAKFTNQKIASDDQAQAVNVTYESKRDRWNGFQSEMYKEVIKEHQQFQQIRKKTKNNQDQQQLDQQYKKSQNPLDLASLPSKNAKNQKFQGLGNVRNREDWAKYLLTLDLNGPHFDPKSRAMKGQNLLQSNQSQGDKALLQQQINFASQQQQKHHAQISSIALPTLTQKIYRDLKSGVSSSSNLAQASIKYDALSGQKKNSQLIVYQQNDDFQFAALRAIKKPTTIKSKYQQNFYINDHTSVWGSWYSKVLGWGFACCYNTEKTGYCLGEKGKQKALAKELRIKAQNLRQQEQLADILQAKQEQDS